MTKHLISSDPM